MTQDIGLVVEKEPTGTRTLVNGTLFTSTSITSASPATATTDFNPNDPRHGYRSIRYNTDSRERDIVSHRASTLWNHASPQSVYVAAMGNHWTPGSWQHVIDMVDYTNRHGYRCQLEEIMDRCFRPYDSLGCMRNEAIMRANQGWDWLLYVDNDVYPDPDDLVALIDRDRSIIAPYVAEPGSGKPLHGPFRSLWTGVQEIRWCVLSMLLIRTSVFRGPGVEFWNDSIGADEGYHFQKIWDYGHRPYLDTDIALRVGNIPTYPLATLRMPKADAEDFWDRRRESLLKVPDREPINPNDPRRTPESGYAPFAMPGMKV